MIQITTCSMCGEPLKIANRNLSNKNIQKIHCHCLEKTKYSQFLSTDLYYYKNELIAYWLMFNIDDKNIIISSDNKESPFGPHNETNIFLLGEESNTKILLKLGYYYLPDSLEEILSFIKRSLNLRAFL